MELVKYPISYKNQKFEIYGYEPTEYISSYFAKGRFYEEPLLTYLKNRFGSKGIKQIVDVGAHVGNHALFFKEVMKIPEVVAFEANEDNYARLIRNTKDVTCYNVALSDESGTLQSVFNPQNTGASYLVSGEGVKAKTLDAYSLAPDLIKIDAEGRETSVLRGAKETIKIFLPTMIVEHQDIQKLYEFNRALAEIVPRKYHLEVFAEPTWEMFIYRARA